MSVINVDIKEYEDKYTDFIVIKDFYKMGSAVMGFTFEQDVEFRSVLSRCLMIAQSPLQVVRLSGRKSLTTWGEYSPYTVYDNVQDLLDISISGNCPGTINPYIKDSPYLTNNDNSRR